MRSRSRLSLRAACGRRRLGWRRRRVRRSRAGDNWRRAVEDLNVRVIIYVLVYRRCLSLSLCACGGTVIGGRAVKDLDIRVMVVYIHKVVNVNSIPIAISPIRVYGSSVSRWTGHRGPRFVLGC